jgi:hypothetical protein
MNQSSSSRNFNSEELSIAVKDYFARNPEMYQRLLSMDEPELKNRSDGTPFYEVFTDIRNDGERRDVETERDFAQGPPRLTGDPDVDLAARYIYAEGSNNEEEMRAICQTFVNRYNANRAEFGGQNAARLWERLSIADDNGGSRSFREAADNESLRLLPPADQERYRTASAAAQYVLRDNPNRDERGGGILPSDDYYYFLGRGAKTPGLRIGATTFYDFYPPHGRGQQGRVRD